MGNPFTRFINRSNPDEDFNRFVSDWDDLEALLIDVFRSGRTDEDDAAVWKILKDRLAISYPRFAERLGRHAQDRGSAFDSVLSLESITDMIGNRPVLKALPNAREIINLTILAWHDGSE